MFHSKYKTVGVEIHSNGALHVTVFSNTPFLFLSSCSGQERDEGQATPKVNRWYMCLS